MAFWPDDEPPEDNWGCLNDTLLVVAVILAIVLAFVALSHIIPTEGDLWTP